MQQQQQYHQPMLHVIQLMMGQFLLQVQQEDMELMNIVLMVEIVGS